jgi:hypothetical protein
MEFNCVVSITLGVKNWVKVEMQFLHVSLKLSVVCGHLIIF